MNTEYEVKILDVDHNSIVTKLESLGAQKVMDVLQRRYVYDLIPVDPKRWIRLRTDGSVTTVTLKSIEDLTIDGTKELEIEVGDFAKTNILLNMLGFTSKGFQENKRIRYILDGVEIDLDRWPMIPEYMEIEGSSPEEIYRILEKLGLDKDNVVTLDVASIYDHYGFDGKNLHDLNFGMEDEDEKF